MHLAPRTRGAGRLGLRLFPFPLPRGEKRSAPLIRVRPAHIALGYGSALSDPKVSWFVFLRIHATDRLIGVMVGGMQALDCDLGRVLLFTELVGLFF